jgi:predicted GIY-YIG superfamily endonuclease
MSMYTSHVSLPMYSGEQEPLFAVGRHITWLAAMWDSCNPIGRYEKYYASGTITHLTNATATLQYDEGKEDCWIWNPMPKWHLADRVYDPDLQDAIKNSIRPSIIPDGDYHIYTITDPRTQLVRYVGMSKHVERRMQQHEQKKRGCNYHWLQELVQRGIAPIVTLMESDPSKQEALALEKFWIRYYITQGYHLENTQHAASYEEFEGE